MHRARCMASGGLRVRGATGDEERVGKSYSSRPRHKEKHHKIKTTIYYGGGTLSAKSYRSFVIVSILEMVTLEP